MHRIFWESIEISSVALDFLGKVFLGIFFDVDMMEIEENSIENEKFYLISRDIKFEKLRFDKILADVERFVYFEKVQFN